METQIIKNPQSHGMTKEEFVIARTGIISKMLDNPKNGIYPTTIAFAELDDLYDQMNVHGYGKSGAQKLRDEGQEKNRFTIGDLVRRKSETLTHPQGSESFTVNFIMERQEAAGGFLYSEDNDRWIAQDYLELVVK